jgi:hypothetical protein
VCYFSTHKHDYFCYGYILSRSADMVVVDSNDLYWHLFSLSTYFLNHSTSQLGLYIIAILSSAGIGGGRKP